MMMPRMTVKFVISFHSRRKGKDEHYNAQHAESALYGRPGFEDHNLYVDPADEDDGGIKCICPGPVIAFINI